mgnify:CR=1 FL=1
MVGDQVEVEDGRKAPATDDGSMCPKTERGWSERQVHWRRHREVLAPETITERLFRSVLSVDGSKEAK